MESTDRSSLLLTWGVESWEGMGSQWEGEQKQEEEEEEEYVSSEQGEMSLHSGPYIRDTVGHQPSHMMQLRQDEVQVFNRSV